ncbi:hypothetical protein, conserved [Eimeria maxima]|uniref:Uncharacterized protein n=1 Tax=Eimeria maxima TaxID=5804 RepID=U6MFQ2_EIMMA|nr:hypothetical protein, conserved [Eimeria maxima]CDJ61289.1 hypothetical protein, conserved [Eimeria maxima]
MSRRNHWYANTPTARGQQGNHQDKLRELMLWVALQDKRNKQADGTEHYQEQKCGAAGLAATRPSRPSLALEAPRKTDGKRKRGQVHRPRRALLILTQRETVRIPIDMRLKRRLSRGVQKRWKRFAGQKIARGVHRGYDPVLGDDKQCVVWYGDLSEDDNLPVIRMVKPGETQESQTYVNRTLVFLYADEESFNELQEKPKKAFTMACANPLCVNLTHIALDD